MKTTKTFKKGDLVKWNHREDKLGIVVRKKKYNVARTYEIVEIFWRGNNKTTEANIDFLEKVSDD